MEYVNQKSTTSKGELYTEYVTKGLSGNSSEFNNFLQGGLGAIEEKAIGHYRGDSAEILFPPEIAKKVSTTIDENSPIINLCKSSQVKHSLHLSVLIDENDYPCQWLSFPCETEETPTKNFQRLDISTHELCSNPAATSSILETSDLEEWIVSMVAKSFGRTITRDILVGNGKNKPFGIIYRALEEENIAGKIKVHKIEKTNLLPNLLSICFSLPSVYSNGAVWIMSRSLLVQLAKETIDQKRNLFIYDNSGDVKFLGYPVYVDDALEETKCCIFGKLQEGYQYVSGRDIKIIRDPYSKKGMVQFYTTIRVGGDIINSRALLVCKLE